MILNSRTIFPSLRLFSAATTRRERRAMVSFPVASGDHRIDTEKLRSQLEQLRAEANITWTKANNARLRLMRLSEAAENLQQRAAADVLVGKVNEARELLMQKKKLMQALEKSRYRIEVLDKLSMKINEAISLKETQLIENVAVNPEFSREVSCHQIRLIYPKDVVDEDSNKIDISDPECTKSDEIQELVVQMSDGNLNADCAPPVMELAANVETSNDNNVFCNFKDMSSYKDFLGYVDGQLREVETDLVEFLRFSTLILESEQRHMNTKVKQTSEILKDLRIIRERIAINIKTYIDDRQVST